MTVFCLPAHTDGREPVQLPEPRDAAEAERMRVAYAAGAIDVLYAANVTGYERTRARATVRRLAATLFPAFPAPVRA